MARTLSVRAGQTTGQWAARALTAVVGAVFLLVGVLGFIPGATTHFGRIKASGHESGAELFGLFQTSVLHNFVHLVFGVVGLLAARTVATARAFLLIGGTLYLVLWIYGLIVDQGTSANVLPVNNADNWLHLGLGIGMLGLGLLTTRSVPGPQR